MENSFFEYRDDTGAKSDSDSEIMENSFSQIPKTPGKKNQTVFVPESESDDLTSDESDKENTPKNTAKSVTRRSSIKLHDVVISSDDDKSRRGSIRRQSASSNKVVITSSDDERTQMPPKVILKCKPNPSPRSSGSFIGRKKKKHMILLDSESDNSFIKEHSRKKKCLKETPIKIDGVRNNVIREIQNMSIQSNDTIKSDDEENDVQSDKDDESQKSDESDDENLSQDDESQKSDESDDENLAHDDESQSSDENDDEDQSQVDESQSSDESNVENEPCDDASESEGEIDDKAVNKKEEKNYINHKCDTNRTGENHDSDTSEDEVSDININLDNKKQAVQSYGIDPSINEGNSVKQYNISNYARSSTEDSSITNDKGDAASVDGSTHNGTSSTSDDGLEEEQMLMSRATRMSIMGVMPKENDSDDSDYIESDDTNHSSRASSMGTLHMEPDTETQVTASPEKPTNAEEVLESSKISCSPISSPLRDVPYEINDSSNKNEPILNSNDYSPELCGFKSKVQNKVNKEVKRSRERVINDEVTIIENEPEIIALSSDDEVEEKDDKKSPQIKKSPQPKGSTTQLKSSDIKQFLPPPSYPNQNIVYVKKHVRENELNKLNGLREDLQNIRYLMENMDVETLPDRGAKLLGRLDALEREVQKQGNKVANMVVEPDMPTPNQMSKDGFAADKDKGLSWDDIQKASNAVQPRMFGKQAMATHMAERNLILERLRDLYESLASRPPESSLATQPAGVRSELMEHQLHALAWLRWRETQRPSGGILADDMGLGKTITMISLIVADKEGSLDNDDDDEDEDEDRGPRLARGGTLVVCPATLVQQWAGEVGKHCKPHALSVCLHHGAARTTQPHRLATNDLVITTYNILQRESEKHGVLSRVRWRRVILDEAHVVRNHKSATSQGVCGLRGRRRWALTGTPLHNKDLDLFALLKFLRCTPFDDLTMWKKWIDNKSLGGSERLNTIMSCVMLRRTKLQLQEKGQLNCLPERSAHEVTVTLAQEEMNVYQKVLVFSKTLFAQYLHQRAEKQSGMLGGVPPKKDSEYAKMHKRMIALQGAKPVKSHEILVLLLRLRQVCCHCGLIAAMLDPDDNSELAEDVGSQDLLAELNKLTLEDNNASRRLSGGKKDEEEETEPVEGTTAAEAIKSVLSPNNPVFDLQRQSSKIHAVMECLNTNVFKNKGEKAVIVSQWTSVLNLVERELKAARIRCVTLRGDVPVPARAPLISALNDPRSDVRVMLLSLCAGGVGLNLCGANHLLLLDPHWNPQLEEQAQDRIYRVGQTKHVHIYRFMCVDTVEQSIRQLQKAKLEMAESVLTGARNTNGSKLSIEDLKLLFNMQPQ